MSCGIYQIKCLKNNRMYIGSSSNIERRWKIHVRELKNNLHSNTHLQRAWTKYGKELFEFSIIEECYKELLIERENFYFQTIQPFSPKGFNIGTSAKGGDNITKNPKYEQICENISKGGKERFKNMSKEEKKKYSENLKGEKNGMYNKHHTKESKRKISEKQKNNPNNFWKKRKGKTNIEIYGEEKAKEISIKLSKIDKNGKNNPFYGMHHTSETKEKIRKKAIGRKPSNCKKILIDDVIYPSVCEAHRQLNIHPTTIVWRLRSNNFPNYKYL